jgi:hypothetical protein
MRRALLGVTGPRGAWLALALLAAVLFASVHLTGRYALYVVSGSGASREARLFLDPFPDRIACELRARDLASDGARGSCREYETFDWGSALDRSIAAQVARAGDAYGALCAPRAPRALR